MADTPSDTQEHLQHNLHDHYDIADLAASPAGAIVTPEAVTSSTVQMYDAHFSMHPSSPDHLAVRTIGVASSLERNGVNHPSSYNIIEDDSARNSTHNIPLNPHPAQLLPPALPRISPISLPPLSPNIPIQIHALITYRPSTSPIFWNMSLPPSTALLAIADSSVTRSMSRWSRDVAVAPRVSSFTIRIRGVERPVVVFPVETGLPIRIVDILRAVYDVIRAEALENGAGAGDVPAYGANGQGSRRGLRSDDVMAADAIRRHLRNRVWWNGISQSLTEVDVWVLHLRGPIRGRFQG